MKPKPYGQHVNEWSADANSDENVQRTDTALPLWIAMSIRCFRKKVNLGSPGINSEATTKHRDQLGCS